jgi:hypothetical protein
MIYLLIAIYVVVCLLILYKTITQFKVCFDWFSAILYTLIFIVSCGILYLLLFTPYYLLN